MVGFVFVPVELFTLFVMFLEARSPGPGIEDAHHRAGESGMSNYNHNPQCRLRPCTLGLLGILLARFGPAGLSRILLINARCFFWFACVVGCYLLLFTQHQPQTAMTTGTRLGDVRCCRAYLFSDGLRSTRSPKQPRPESCGHLHLPRPSSHALRTA